jgi:hypothetical protein
MTVRVPGPTPHGNANVADPSPNASVVMVPRVLFFATIVKVVLAQSPDRLTTIVLPWLTVVGVPTSGVPTSGVHDAAAPADVSALADPCPASKTVPGTITVSGMAAASIFRTL